MLLKLLALVVLSSACLTQVNFSQPIYPSFLSEDSDPYLLTKVYLQGSQEQIAFAASSKISVFFNGTAALQEQTSPVAFNVTAGRTEIALKCNSQYWTFVMYANEIGAVSPSVALSSYSCPAYECGSVTARSVTVSPSSQVLRFSIPFRGDNATLASSLVLSSLDNYVVVSGSSAVSIYHLYYIPKANTLLTFEAKTGNLTLQTSPRQHPDVYSYTLLQKLGSSSKYQIDIRVTSPVLSYLTYYSNSQAYSAVSGDWTSSVAFNQLGEVILVELRSGAYVPEFYYFQVKTQSTDKYMKSVTLYKTNTLMDFKTYTRSQLVSVLGNYTPIAFEQAYNQLRPYYSIADLDYDPNYNVIIDLEPNNAAQTLYILNSSSVFQEYVQAAKTARLRPGLNAIELQVVAEDPNFSQRVSIEVYMKKNDTRLSRLIVPGTWTPPYSDSADIYRVDVPFNATEIALEAEVNDATSVVSFAGAHLSNVTQGIIASARLNLGNAVVASFEVDVQAESAAVKRVLRIAVTKLDICGNGLRYSVSEVCDDGNTQAGDGCSSTCSLESNYTCMGGSQSSPDVCTVSSTPKPNNTTPDPASEDPEDPGDPGDPIDPIICGNGVIEEGEECDDGNQQGGDGCSQSCKVESNGQVCGDGIRIPNDWGSLEDCDDGNLLNGDGCSANCTVEIGWTCLERSLIEKVAPKPDVCTPNNGTKVYQNASNEEGSSRYSYIGVIIFFALAVTGPALVVLHQVIIKVTSTSQYSSVPGFGWAVTLCQVLYSFSFVNTTPTLQQMFQSFSWSVLKFPLSATYETSVILPFDQDDNGFCKNVALLLVVLGLVLLGSFGQFLVLDRAKAREVATKCLVVYFQATSFPYLLFGGLQLRHTDFTETYDIVNFAIAIVFLIGILAGATYYTWASFHCSMAKPTDLLYPAVDLTMQGTTVLEQPPQDIYESSTRRLVFSADVQASKKRFSLDELVKSEPVKCSQPATQPKPKKLRFIQVYTLQLLIVIIHAAAINASEVQAAQTVPIAVALLVYCGLLLHVNPFKCRIYLIFHAVSSASLALLCIFLPAYNNLDTVGIVILSVGVVVILVSALLAEVCMILNTLLSGNEPPNPPDEGAAIRAFTLSEEVVSSQRSAPSQVSVSIESDEIPNERNSDSMSFNHTE